ncbi:PRC-barrel domain-containing protein [Martelella endophytica]|uniref:PRC-barrel domain-containing protein n=1 Tax=Martelella endophytica TaxID=1486262 RepID=A0A0D5LTH5_MAREN|nr:PRC-barrel domain-containing protein [Martelella endophytica]AJY47285.1 hypothetical protein TM49_19000 [Martelella endophytica]
MSVTRFTTTVAACALLAGSVYAQDQPANETTTQADTMKTMDMSTVETSPNQLLGSELLGATVYTSQDEDADAVGDVDDLLVDEDGEIAGLIIGVGGFLGIAEKNVAVPFAKVGQTRDDQNMLHLTLATSREELENAPDFDYRAVTPSADMRTDISDNEDMAADRSDRYPDGETAPTTPTDRMAGEGSSTAPEGAGDIGYNTMTDSSAGMAWRDMEQVSNESLRADDLIGAVVYGENGDEIGDIGDVILKPEGEVQAFIVDVGGFLGLGEKEVAMSSENLTVRRDGDDFAVFTQFTESQLEDQPEYDANAFGDNPDEFMMR